MIFEVEHVLYITNPSVYGVLFVELDVDTRQAVNSIWTISKLIEGLGWKQDNNSKQFSIILQVHAREKQRVKIA